jgi:phosphoribosylpyrophosphate synthetase
MPSRLASSWSDRARPVASSSNHARPRAIALISAGSHRELCLCCANPGGTNLVSAPRRVNNRPSVPLAGRTVIVADDGIATGSTARTALRAIRNAGAGKIVLAVPVAPKGALDELQTEVDEIICLSTPSPFFAVGAHYAEFGQLVDADVISLLKQSALGDAL